MSRTTLSLLTAAALAVVSIGVIITRYRVLGDEVYHPGGPGVWKVTLVVQGRTTDSEARVHTLAPLELAGQHLLREHGRSDEFRGPTAGPAEAGHRALHWSARPGVPVGPFRLHYECYCTLPDIDADRPTAEAPCQHAPPGPGDLIGHEPGIDSDHPEVAELARSLTDGLDSPLDWAEALFRHVEYEIVNEPRLSGTRRSAVECLRLLSGDSAAKSRLLTALLRNRGIPARLVTGLTLTRADEETEHVWVEAWLRDRWLPMCPFYRHFGRVPRTFLVLGYGDLRLVGGKNVARLGHAFLVERVAAPPGGSDPGWAHRAFAFASLLALSPAQQRLASFLMLLPVAALIVCVFRNLVGVNTFGTFAPALVGLAFRELHGWWGVAVFVAVLLIGWLMRRSLNRLHLLQVPRTALLLTLVVTVLLGFITLAARRGWPGSDAVALFPMVILTGMIERFWTLEEEDGTSASFRTLVSTLAVACGISLVVGWSALARFLLACPESLGLVMAGQLLLGRYTGYRLLELYRFRELLPVPVAPPVQVFRDRRPIEGPRF